MCLVLSGYDVKIIKKNYINNALDENENDKFLCGC